MAIWPQGVYRKIIIMTLSLVFITGFLGSYLGYDTMLQNNKEKALKNNMELARSEAQVINSFLKGALEDSAIIAKNPLIASNDPNVRNRALGRLFKEVNIFNGVNVVDSNGNIISFYPGNENIVGKNISQRDYVQKVLQTGEQYISNPYVALTNNWVVVVASPIKDNNNKTIGLVAGSINLINNESLSTLMKNIEVGENGYSFIVSADGKYVYHPDKNKIMKNALAENETYKNIIKSKASSGTITDSNGEKFLAGYAPVDQSGWSVVVQIPEKEANDVANNLLYKMILIILLIVLATILVAVRMAKRITSPLRELVTASEQVASGDYSVNVKVDSQDEIGILGQTFNDMVLSIGAMRNDILNKKRQLEKINKELQVMANTDGLTKLYNHRYFQEAITTEILKAQIDDLPLSLLMIDIDHFKHYNDLFGHLAGDQLLKELAGILRKQVDATDIIARYGGEEFAVVMPAKDINKAKETAEGIRNYVENYRFFGREQQPDNIVSVSIGVASYPKNAANKEDLIKLADEALYKAKTSHRNKVEMYFSVLDELKNELNASEVELINSIKMLLRIINAKDKYTSGHSERVGAYATAIGEELKLGPEDMQTIKIGAYLHDIGKIEITRDILTKEGKLTEEEYELIKMHPVWGADIIKSVEILAPTIPLVLYHHENYNGCGYPKGLKEEEIPLLARIMAVADSYDAMTSNRPYRSRMSTGEAKQELLRCAGTQFDPEIVSAFIKSQQRIVNFIK